MSQISPPFRIVLVGAVAFMAAWMLFLRPGLEPAPTAPAPAAAAQEPAATAESEPGRAVAQAKAAAERASARRARDAAASSGAATERSSAARAPRARRSAAGTAARTAGLPRGVRAAIEARRVLVLLFWTPRAADDRAVRAELASVHRHGGRVAVRAVPMRRYAAYQRIARGAAVEQSPTVVVVDRNRRAATLVGYADSVSIDQLVSDALRVR